jgi:adenosylcobinamide kinase/adenosylcobinamide-phosphate guanylyltransferase
MNTAILVTGGARSGKSRFAQQWAEGHPLPRTYLATARRDPGDAEMSDRIARHQADRAGRGWTTCEVGADLAGAISALPPHGVALVDCVTLWLSGVAYEQQWDVDRVLAAVDRVAAVVAAPPCDLCLVTNEVGDGIVPPTPEGRAFRDLQGWCNQRLAAAAASVVLVVCGLPWWLKRAEGATCAR